MTAPGYIPQPSDLLCACMREFWSNRQDIPEKLTVIVTSSNYLQVLILQINLRKDALLISYINFPKEVESVKTIWTMFPKPLETFTKMVRNKSLPILKKGEIKANYTTINKEDIKNFVKGF